jgi:predicted amidohydrolase YtcJ
LRFETADVAEHILRCAEAGLQAGFHAIGDAAVDQVLDAVDVVAARIGRMEGGRHRIEHAAYVRDPVRLAASGLLASMQPGFDAHWGGPEGMYAQRVGPERALALHRFGDLAAAGVPLAFGSDSPVTELGPWAAVRAAVHPSDPAAAIGTAAAFTAHTEAGWRFAGRDGEGVLVAGAPATFAVWRAGSLASGLPDVAPGLGLPQCLATVRRGTTIFDGELLEG